MFLKLVGLLLLTASVSAQAEEVVPGSLQDAQAQKFLNPLNAAQVECPASLSEAESDFLCATTSGNATAFRDVVDANAAHLKPVGPWASSSGDDQQRSFLYKDGFMTVTFFPSDSASSDSMMVVQYAMPHD